MYALNTFMYLSNFSTDLAVFDVSFDKSWKFCMKFGHIAKENYLICCHQMSDFKAKMRQIQFWLGELTAFPQTL